MVLLLLILAAQTAGVPQTGAPHGAVAPFGSGAELVVQCVAAEAMALGSVPANSDQVEKGALCIGYVDGYVDGAKKDVCIPPRSLMVVIHSYLQYMRENPQYYDIPKAAGLRAAVDATFPCGK
jgi:hypothetical protein